MTVPSATVRKLPACAFGTAAGGLLAAPAAAAALPAAARPAPTAEVAAPASRERRDREGLLGMVDSFQGWNHQSREGCRGWPRLKDQAASCKQRVKDLYSRA